MTWRKYGYFGGFFGFCTLLRPPLRGWLRPGAGPIGPRAQVQALIVMALENAPRLRMWQSIKITNLATIPTVTVVIMLLLGLRGGRCSWFPLCLSQSVFSVAGLGLTTLLRLRRLRYRIAVMPSWKSVGLNTEQAASCMVRMGAATTIFDDFR